MWLDLQLYIAALTLLALVYLLVDSKRPVPGCRRVQATRNRSTQR